MPRTIPVLSAGQPQGEAAANIVGLPAEPTPLIGREQEARTARDLLRRPEVRLLTLAGPPGIGKTRLGVHVAASIAPGFPDGVYFVPLAPITEPDLVLPTIAQTIGVKEAAGQPLIERVGTQLGDKRVLLVLDNFEQVLDAATVASELLSQCPGLKVMATSRQVLHLRGEHELHVAPLSLPDLSTVPDVQSLSRSDAVMLFVQRARAVRLDFQVTDANAGTLAEICLRLDGIPLAIELAAVRTKVLSPEAILARLSNRLQLLTGGPRDLPERHKTLRNAIEWSHDLLDEAEQRVFRRLSVFAGGCTLDAVAQVCGRADEWQLDVLAELTALLDKSLLGRQEGIGDEPRFTMLETIREYAQEKLQESDEEEEIRARHAAYYLALAERAELEFDGGEQMAQWLVRLDKEHDNMRAVLHWATDDGERNASRILAGVRLAWALWRYWLVRGYITEGLDHLESVLSAGAPVEAERAEPGAVTTRAKALLGAGHLAYARGAYSRAYILLEEGLKLARITGHIPTISNTLGNLGLVAREQGDYDRARACFTECLAMITEAVETIGESSYRWGIANILRDLGWVALYEGDYQGAHTFFERSLETFQQFGEKWGIAYALTSLGSVELRLGNYTSAGRQFRESLKINAELGDKQITANCLEGSAHLAASDDKVLTAAQLWGTAQALRESTGITMAAPDREFHDRAVAEARSRIDEPQWESAWTKGRSLPLAEAIALGLRTGPGQGEHDASDGGGWVLPAPPYPDDLTAREVEVLHLLAMDLTNAEIAQQLYLSRRTVHAHLRSIYAKIQTNNRSGAIRYAREHNLV